MPFSAVSSETLKCYGVLVSYRCPCTRTTFSGARK